MDELNAAVASLERARVVNYVSVASTALVAYDYVITFGDEVRLVWPSKWTIGKAMFFLTRYPIFVDCALNLVLVLQPYLAFNLCQPLYEAASWMCFIGIAIAEIIMAMRTYAIWGKNLYAGGFLALLNIAVIIPDIILIQRAMESLVFMPSPFPTLAPCILIHADLTVYVDLVLIMVTEFIIVAMTFYKGYTQWRETKSSLVKAFLRDGLQYFVCMFAISLANVFVFKLAVVDYTGLLLLLQRVLHAMLSSRILLELREAVNSTSDNGPKQGQDGISKVSTMDFAPRDERNKRRVNDGLSFDARGRDTVDVDGNTSDMFEDSAEVTGTGFGTGTIDYALGDDAESQLRSRNVPLVRDIKDSPQNSGSCASSASLSENYSEKGKGIQRDVIV